MNDQFLPTYEEDNVSIDFNDEIRSILVYIGLITVILVFIFFIFALINKCIKMFNNQTITKPKIKKHQRYYSNPIANRQASMSSVSSSLFLLNYQTSKSSYLRTQQHLPSIVNV